MVVLREAWGSGLADAVLVWDGRDVLTVNSAGEVVSLLRRTGQTLIRETVTQLTTFPVGQWAKDIALEATPIDVEAIIEGRARRRGRAQG